MRSPSATAKQVAAKRNERRDSVTVRTVQIASIAVLGENWVIGWVMPRAWRGATMAADRRMDRGADPTA